MKDSDLTTPLIDKYTDILDKNPRSPVFAPLAEAYRKMGLVKQALKILKQGIRYNPEYVLGHLGVAYCYYDLGEFTLAYNTLKPYAASDRQNILLQKLFGDICLKVGHQDEALETFKFLLFINPKDEYAAKIVKDIEDRSVIAPAGNIDHILTEQPVEDLETSSTFFQVDNLEDNFDEWVEVSLSSEVKEVETEAVDGWKVEKEPVLESSNDESPVIKEVVKSKEPEKAVVTHTLVDLYCQQGHFLKACEVLEKIIELNPSDISSIEKLEEIKEFLAKEDFEPEEPKDLPQEIVEKVTVEKEAQKAFAEDHSNIVGHTEEDGREFLMSLINNHLETSHEKTKEVDESKTVEIEQQKMKLDSLTSKLWQFHQKLSEKSQNYPNP